MKEKTLKFDDENLRNSMVYAMNDIINQVKLMEALEHEGVTDILVNATFTLFKGTPYLSRSDN